uniref:CUB_2 domain-containing protein n=1 Tax=Caenorhabditis tropicalis TaxID=1561998 RepID=A0A1I7TH61_9PELO
MLLLFIFAVISGSWALGETKQTNRFNKDHTDCTQILESQIFNASRIFIPGGDGSLQPLPAHFNCLYTIKAPANSTSGYSAKVVLKNGIKGVNDVIYVVDMRGRKETMNNKTGIGGEPYEYVLPPGTEMSIQVITKSVFMNSMFSITVEYHAAKIGPTIEMKTNREMNFIDVNTLREEGYLYATVTFIGLEPIYWSLASVQDNSIVICYDCYAIDGTLTNMTRILEVLEVIGTSQKTTVSNAVTFLTCVDDFFGVVLNTQTEFDQKILLGSTGVERYSDNWVGMRNMAPGYVIVQEVVNFDGPGIVMTDLEIKSPVCKAYVISGPPNNSSTILLDLANASVPTVFGRQYFSFLNVDCEFECTLKQFKII